MGAHRKPNLIWGALFAIGITYEVLAIRQERFDDTLTRTTRRATCFHPASRTLFATGWLSFAVWFLQHVLKKGDPQ